MNTDEVVLLADALKPSLTNVIRDPMRSVVAAEWAEELLAPDGAIETIIRGRAAPVEAVVERVLDRECRAYAIAMRAER